MSTNLRKNKRAQSSSKVQNGKFISISFHQFTFNAQPPKPYAVMKLHKVDHPIKIIITNINSPSYHLSNYIHEILIGVTENSPYNVKNSYELKEKLNSTCITDNEIMASLDVVAMYENIPWELVYKSIKTNGKA